MSYICTVKVKRFIYFTKRFNKIITKNMSISGFDTIIQTNNLEISYNRASYEYHLAFGTTIFREIPNTILLKDNLF